MKIELTSDEFEQLLLVIGYAGGAANLAGETWMFYQAFRMANAVNRGNPNYTPYFIPEIPPQEKTE